MRYMTFIIHREDYRQQDVPPSLFEAMGKFVAESQTNGTFIDGAGLEPSAKGFRVSLRNKKIKVTDGPFTESKEVVGGYAIIEAKSRQEAVAIATEFMDIHRVHWPEFEGSCEVRPLEAEAQKSA